VAIAPTAIRGAKPFGFGLYQSKRYKAFAANGSTHRPDSLGRAIATGVVSRSMYASTTLPPQEEDFGVIATP